MVRFRGIDDMILSGPLESAILVLLNFTCAVALVALAYYALQIFVHMRMGRLERGWKFVTEGVIFMSSGFFFVALDHAFPRAAVIYFYIGAVGTILSLVGVVFMLLGLHSHYVVWYKKSIPSLIKEDDEPQKMRN